MRLSVAFLCGLLQLASCQTCEDWAEFQGNCYYVNSGEDISEPDVDWHGARDACLAEGGELASIQSDEERDFVLETASAAGQTDNLWLGLNQLADRDGEYEWSDGSATDYTSYAPDEPKQDGLHQCIYSKGSATNVCFSRENGINAIEGLFERPSDAKPPDTHYFGYRLDTNEPEWCEEKCGEEKDCFSFTHISTKHPDHVWQGECMGANVKHDISEPDTYATSGRRVDCGEDVGIWHSDNCGIKKGYVCKKSPGAAPGTVPPTTTVPGYCPQGWFGLDSGNKCYKVVEVDTDFEGVDWEEARDACRAEQAYQPDLASLHDLQEQSIVTAQLQMYTLGVWIGYFRDGDYHDWMWTDNSRPDDFTYWAEGEPSYGNEHCVELILTRRPLGMWNNFPCHEPRGYVCQSWKDSSNPIMSPAPTTPHSCGDGYIPHWYGCYKFVSTPTSWAGAEQACAQEQGHLASVHAEAENAALLVITKGQKSWLGFRKGGDDEFRWTDGWPTRFQRWSEGEPDDQHACALINDMATWDSADCDDLQPYVCKTTDVPRPTTPPVGDGACPSSSWKIYGNHCYYFAPANYPDYEQSSWADSLEACVRYGQDHSHPASLASIHSWPENEFIYNTLNEMRGDDMYYLTRAWIGLSKKELGAPFLWTDGTPYDFTAWMPGEPNDEDGSENCVEMYVEPAPGLWNDHFCTSVSSFVCKTELGDPPTTPTRPPDVPGDCPESGDWAAYGAHCYLFMPDEYESWDAAHGQCKGFGGSIANLASIHSSAENYWILTELVDRSNMPTRRGAWIGLKKTSSDNAWSWIEPDQEVVFENFAADSGDPGSPNNCVEMSSANGLWYDEVCSQLRGYVCRAAKVMSSKPKSKCQKLREQMLRNPMIGAYEPRCTDAGLFEKIQCHGGTGECWCVDENGFEVKGTVQKAPNKVDCDNILLLSRQSEFRQHESEFEEFDTRNDRRGPVDLHHHKHHASAHRNPQMQHNVVHVVSQEDDKMAAGTVAAIAIGSVLIVAGIIAALVVVKKTPKKPRRNQHGDDLPLDARHI